MAQFAPRKSEGQSVQPQKLAPFVASPLQIGERMLEVAGVKGGDVVYDLGCGDGRILFAAAKRFGAKAVGVEISEQLVKKVNRDAQQQGLSEQVTAIQSDLRQVDVSPASVVALYLLTEANEEIRPKLERELKPGTRVVSLDFKFKDWKPVKVEKVEAHHRSYTIYLYEMPPQR